MELKILGISNLGINLKHVNANAERLWVDYGVYGLTILQWAGETLNNDECGSSQYHSVSYIELSH